MSQVEDLTYPPDCAVLHLPFRVETTIPTPRPRSEQSSQATYDINHDPEAMFQIYEEEERNGEGWLIPLTGGGAWVAAAVTKPYVNSQEATDLIPHSNSHYLISPRLKNRFATPSNLSPEEITPAARHIQGFMDNPFAYVSYNIGEDDRGWHAHAQSWANWHIHLEQNVPGDTLKPVDKVDITRKEPGDKVRLDFFRECITRAHVEGQEDLLGSLKLANFLGKEEGQKAFGHAPQGLVFTLPKDIPPERMASVMKDLDSLYRAFHKNIYECMVKNYDEVAESGWQLNYDVRRPEEMEEELKKRGIEEESVAVQFLREARHAVEQSQVTDDPNKRVYKSPCYTVSMRRELVHNNNGSFSLGGYAFILDPHSLRKNGGVEARGITIKRNIGVDGNENLRQVVKSSRERFLSVNTKV